MEGDRVKIERQERKKIKKNKKVKNRRNRTQTPSSDAPMRNDYRSTTPKMVASPSPGDRRKRRRNKSLSTSPLPAKFGRGRQLSSATPSIGDASMRSPSGAISGLDDMDAGRSKSPEAPELVVGLKDEKGKRETRK